MYIKRDITDTLIRFSKFPVVVVLGPRQSGKTTVVKETFNKHTYVSLEDPAILSYATHDPRGFLERYRSPHGIIIDEFQHAPQLLSYIQLAVDEEKKPGYFVLTGSENFLMNQEITQTLAGRAGILTLLPFSLHELKENNLLTDNLEIIIKGGYPRLHVNQFTPEELYPSYIHSYIERDVRQIMYVENLFTFQKFMQLCAGRIGQLLNINDIATNCGITRKTADNWLSALEASYTIFLLKPYFNNFNKRIIKTPKLYFYDTGIACSLLGITSVETLYASPFRGPLFESLIISDLHKQYFNYGLQPHLYFWRTQNGSVEIDCLIEYETALIPIEIKSGQTIVEDFFTPIKKFAEITEIPISPSYIIYAGDMMQKRSNGIAVLGYKESSTLVQDLRKK